VAIKTYVLLTAQFFSTTTLTHTNNWWILKYVKPTNLTPTGGPILWETSHSSG